MSLSSHTGSGYLEALRVPVFVTFMRATFNPPLNISVADYSHFMCTSNHVRIASFSLRRRQDPFSIFCSVSLMNALKRETKPNHSVSVTELFLTLSSKADSPN